MTAKPVSRTLAVILHADVTGSTALVQHDEALAHTRFTDAFRRLSSTIKDYGGTVHEIRGDALVAEFARASDAVAAALVFQQTNLAHNAKHNDVITPVLRMGVSLGEVIIADATVTGPGVVLAQRLEQLAEPGGVCIQQAVYEALPRHLPFDYDALGEQQLKGFDEPVRAYAVKIRSGAEAPTPESRAVTKEPRSRRKGILATVTVSALVVAGVLAWWQPWQTREEPASVERMAFPLPDKPSIAVLPFANLGGDPEQQVFSDGLTNDIITDLSKFKHLFVIASNSTFSYKGKAVKVQQVAEDLGVRYVLEGSFQRAGERLRINVQLIDATTGHHLWAERYDRDASDFFAIQEDILRTIVGSLASQVTAAEIARALGKTTDDLGAYDYYQRAWKLFFTFTKEGNNQALELLEKAIELDPDYARAYGLLAWVHAHNSRYSWSQNPERSLELALEAAQKAVGLAPEDYFSHWALGFALSIHGDFDRAYAGYERAVALNPSDATLLANMGEVLYKTGRAEQAIAQIKLAIRINPRHPEWYFWDLGIAQYFAEQYQEALDALNRMSNPSNGVRRIRAAVLVRLGWLEEAREVISKFIETDLDMTLEDMENTVWEHREYLDRWIDDLRTAGLPEKRPLPLPDKPSIAVLPFNNMSDDPKQEYFVDGMTEDLITDLSKLSGLFVIARNSTFAYKGKSPDVRQVSRELGVKYVLEGSVRRAGEQVRINAQLIDATTGGHVWAERYDGSLDNVFAMQDEVTQKIVTALAVNLTTEEKAVQTRIETQNPKAYDAFLQGWAHYLQRTPDHYAKARDYFETAIELDPKYSRAYAALASVYWKSFFEEWYPAMKTDRDTVKARAREYLDAAMTNPTSLAHQVAAYMHLWRGRWEEAVAAGQQAVDHDPNDADSYVTLGEMLIFTGEPRRALDSIAKARRLDPHNQGYHAFLFGLAQFGLEQFDAAAASLERALELNPELWLQREEFGPQGCDPCLPLAAAYAYLGRKQEAQALVRRLREQWWGANVRTTTAFWPFQHDADRDRLARGLLEAGLPESISDVQ